MTRLREEIDAEITENLMTIEVHQSRVQALREVLERMDRIEGRVDPDALTETSEPKEPRAPRRDVRGAILKALEAPCRLSMLKDAVEALIGPVTESALARALDAMLAQGPDRAPRRSVCPLLPRFRTGPDRTRLDRRQIAAQHHHPSARLAGAKRCAEVPSPLRLPESRVSVRSQRSGCRESH